MMRSFLAPLLVLAAFACSSSSGSGGGGGGGGSSSGGGSGGGGSSSGGGTVTLGQPEQGIATYYNADGSGNCGFDPSPNDLDVAAMNAAEYANSEVCGECVQVTGPNGMVTVRITDQCPDCQKGQLDLSMQAFAKIADVSAGRVDITWQVVACNVTGNLSYYVKDGSSQYWTALQVRNSRLPIATMEYMAAGAWTAIDRQSYNYFVVASGVGPGSYHVRITAVDGQTLTDTLPAVQPSTSVQGSGQFH